MQPQFIRDHNKAFTYYCGPHHNITIPNHQNHVDAYYNIIRGTVHVISSTNHSFQYSVLQKIDSVIFLIALSMHL